MYAVRGPNSLKQQLDQKNNYAYFDQLIERSDFTKLGQGKKSSAFEKNFERKIHAKKLPSSFISSTDSVLILNFTYISKGPVVSSQFFL